MVVNIPMDPEVYLMVIGSEDMQCVAMHLSVYVCYTMETQPCSPAEQPCLPFTLFCQPLNDLSIKIEIQK